MNSFCGIQTSFYHLKKYGKTPTISQMHITNEIKNPGACHCIKVIVRFYIFLPSIGRGKDVL